MKRHSIVRFFAFAVLASLLATVAFLSTGAARADADDVRQLNWQDLIPSLEFDDPFKKLNAVQSFDLQTVAALRQLQAEESKLMSAERRAKLKTLEAKLTASGVDIDYLLSQLERVREARRVQAEAVDVELHGETIRMPGYILPLEFDGLKVKEFLLVPYVGACIHVPPPPANQIVHVKFESGFAIKGLYQPAWVTGKMSAIPTSQSLYLVDGSSNVSVGYALQARSIEPIGN